MATKNDSGQLAGAKGYDHTGARLHAVMQCFRQSVGKGLVDRNGKGDVTELRSTRTHAVPILADQFASNFSRPAFNRAVDRCAGAAW